MQEIPFTFLTLLHPECKLATIKVYPVDGIEIKGRVLPS